MGSSGIDDRNNDHNDVYCGYVLVPVNRVSISTVLGAGFAPGGFITPPSSTPVPISVTAATTAGWNAHVNMNANAALAASSSTNDWQPLLETSAFDRYQPQPLPKPSAESSSKACSGKSAMSAKGSDEMSIETSTQMMSKITMRSRPSSAASLSSVMMPNVVLAVNSSPSSLGMHFADNNDVHANDIAVASHVDNALCCDDVDSDLINAYLADIRSDTHHAEITGDGAHEDEAMHDYLQCFLPINEPVNFRDRDHHHEDHEHVNSHSSAATAADALLCLHDRIFRDSEEKVAVKYAEEFAAEHRSEDEGGAEDTRMEF